MKYETAVITYFVLPSGATSGQRIVLDGTTGAIKLYSANNNLVGQWTPTGWAEYQDGNLNQFPNGSPFKKLQFVPNASGFPTITITNSATGTGDPAFINGSNDGLSSDSTQLGMNGGQYTNPGGGTQRSRLLLGNNSIQLAFIEPVSEGVRAAQIYTKNQQAGLEAYSYTANTVQSHLDVDGTAHTVTITPDSTQIGGIKTPTIQALYSAAISSAWLKVLNAGVWAAITMQGGYVAGAVAPAITLLPDGTLAFRGTMTTRAAPVSGDTCMTTGAALAPTSTRALLVFTLLNPNTVLQLNWNTNGTFQLFGGGPNPPPTTGVSLDSIPPIPVAF